ncbi:dephospho-CoA kinase [Pseudoflavonifractor phocaeensis]|uniref:dephospho-CoA kinase n=1 Tax=Pseudoflavonifractor phocaeensis TaxID=1870988 RepID=UPI001EEB81C5|nr:dephospho-CoA kinase [Pseudoflavonifractor phocaeensis]MCF2596131.1 dephospho-CoA kinase [Pseudoflavonifractor phocaeensis]
MIIIGITGPTGAGKTTALRVLERLGGAIIDADAVYHQLLASNQALRQELEDRFGPLTDGMGHFDRKKLGTIVFADPQAMNDLNAITHRYIQAEIRGRLEQAERSGCPAAAIDAIRLFESGMADLCDATLAITAPPEVRIRRIMAREGIPEDYARARVAAQKRDEYYVGKCGYTLVNDCASPEEFAARAEALFEKLLHTDIG